MKIAVDFDGTIVENAYPEIGQPMLFAFETLKAFQNKGHQLILWTYRSDDKLDKAIAFCEKNGIKFYAVNNSYPEEIQFFDYNKTSRKIDADIFIDDRNVGGFLGWSKIWQLIHPESGEVDLEYINKEAHFNFKRNTFFKRLFSKNDH